MIDDKDLICGAVCARRDRGDRVELWISGNAYSKDIDRIRLVLISLIMIVNNNYHILKKLNKFILTFVGISCQ
jgi:hypothetical protein